jgi:hypothetical protein
VCENAHELIESTCPFILNSTLAGYGDNLTNLTVLSKLQTTILSLSLVNDIAEIGLVNNLSV